MRNANLPVVSIIVETSNWHPKHQIQLWDTLRALEGQSYPRDRLEILVVLDIAHHSDETQIVGSYPWVHTVLAPAGLTYYELKNFGASRASGDILAMTDADCVPCPVWVEELVRSFAEAGPRPAAVQGRTRFLDRPLARAWEASWWSRSFEEEGPIDRLYTSNNVAFRREVYADHHFLPGSPLRTGLERLLTRQLVKAGFGLWLNPRMVVHHNYSPTVREISQQGLVRGYYFMTLRRTYPQGLDYVVKKLGLLAPVICSPLLLIKDIVRIFRKAPKMGIRGRELLKLPLYMSLQVPYNLVVLIGMYWAIFAPDRVPRRPL